MTRQTPRIYGVMATLITATACILALAFVRYQSLIDLNARSGADLNACKELASKIRTAKSSLPVLADQSQDEASSRSRVIAGLDAVAVDQRTMTQFQMRSAPIVPTAFKRSDVVLDLQGIDLEKLFAFISVEESGSPSQVCTDIEIRIAKTGNTTNPADGQPVLWDSRLTLTQVSKSDNSKVKK